MQGEKMLDIQPRSTFGPVDFAAMGRAMGARGYRAETLEEARVALRDAWQGQGPAVIDILTSDDASPSVDWGSPAPDRKSVVVGKSGAVPVDLGGRRSITKKNTNNLKIT